MELTKDKNFKSIIKGIEKDETGDRILVLQLFDQNPFKVNDGDISQVSTIQFLLNNFFFFI